MWCYGQPWILGSHGSGISGEALCIVQLFEPVSQLVARDPQQFGSPSLVATAAVNGLAHESQFCFIKRNPFAWQNKLLRRFLTVTRNSTLTPGWLSQEASRQVFRS